MNYNGSHFSIYNLKFATKREQYTSKGEKFRLPVDVRAPKPALLKLSKTEINRAKISENFDFIFVGFQQGVLLIFFALQF